MDIPSNLLPDFYLWGGGLLYLGIALLALFTAPWRKLADSEAQHVFLGTIVCLSLLWVIRGGIQDGLSFHLLGVTLMCLMFEWQFSLMAVSLIVLTTTVIGNAGWDAFGVNMLLMGIVPIFFTRVVLYLSQRFLPHNFFIYVFVNAFVTGGLSILLVGLASGLVQHWSGVHADGTIFRNFVQVLPLLIFGEAFLNGGVITLIVAYRPQWIATFHDRWYFKKP